MQSPKRANSPPKIIAAAIISIAGLAWCQSLLTSGRVNQLSFVSLAAVVILTGLFISFSDRIKILNLRQLSIELERIAEAREDIEVRAREVRRVAFALAEITLFIATFKDRFRGEGESEIETPWLESKVRDLLAIVSATPEDETKTFRLFTAAKEMDKLREMLDDKEWARRWEEIRKQISNEIKPRD